MQVVGRPCDVCDVPVKSELDGVACLRCRRVFHDACVTDTSAETYRAPKAPKEGAKAKKAKAPAHTICPTCGDDVRALKRDRDRDDARARELNEGERRASLDPGASPGMNGLQMVRLVLALIAFALAILRIMMHR